MTRLLGTLGVACLLSSVASATVSPAPNNHTLRPADVGPVRYKAEPATAKASAAATPEFVLTPDTEVLLDGRACAYKAVPRGASVQRIEVAPDRKTVLRIEFTSPK